VLNLAIGWQMSEIGTQIRQVDVKSGLASARSLTLALAQPDLAQTYKLQTADANLTLAHGELTAKSDTTVGPVLRLSSANDRITASGHGFAPRASGAILVRAGGEKQVAGLTTDAGGRFSVSFPTPVSIPGTYWMQAEVRRPLPMTQWRMSDTLFSSLQGMLETVFLAFIGTAISLLISLPLSFLAARNLASQIPGGWALYSVTRSAFNILRSIEVLIIAVIMAIIVGIGPLAGALALSIHGIGALGKLYSEAIESVEHGPIEAVMSTGANWLQVVRFGAVPQVVPQFISFTMYRWDINVRMATVIGLVGGGGIGNLLYSYINSLQWEKAATAIWLIAIVVMLMDYASAVIRERVV
jgi:phosphonate transport system permease protein